MPVTTTSPKNSEPDVRSASCGQTPISPTACLLSIIQQPCHATPDHPFHWRMAVGILCLVASPLLEHFLVHLACEDYRGFWRACSPCFATRSSWSASAEEGLSPLQRQSRRLASFPLPAEVRPSAHSADLRRWRSTSSPSADLRSTSRVAHCPVRQGFSRPLGRRASKHRPSVRSLSAACQRGS